MMDLNEAVEMSFRIEGSRNAVRSADFFKGGNALFTVSNPKGEHYTYRVRRMDGGLRPYFVSLLTGPDNDSCYTYLGMYYPEIVDLRLTAKSAHKADSKPVKVLRWAFTVIRNGNRPRDGYGIQHEGRCCKCGRTLTTPESIERGMGPDCYAGGL